MASQFRKSPLLSTNKIQNELANFSTAQLQDRTKGMTYGKKRLFDFIRYDGQRKRQRTPQWVSCGPHNDCKLYDCHSYIRTVSVPTTIFPSIAVARLRYLKTTCPS
jgi:hypothetical protein